jgi:curli biogenesis system outer membrane secretion channel CsgG
MYRVVYLVVGVATLWLMSGAQAQQPPAGQSEAEQKPQVAQPAQPGQPAKVSRRKRLAVVDFEVPLELVATNRKSGAGSETTSVQVRTAVTRLGTIVSDMLISALLKQGSFDVIERTQLQKLLEEHQLGKEGLLDPATAAKAGKILGVDLILGGKLAEFGVKEHGTGGITIPVPFFGGVGIRKSTARAVVDARLVDVTTGRILMAEQGEGENKESGALFGGGNFFDFIGAVSFNTSEWTESRIGRATRDAVNQVVQKIIARFPMEATVLLVLPDGTAILDVGKFSGIKEGDEFDILRETLIKDEQTGEVVYRERKKIGVVKVVEMQEDRSKCSAVSGAVESPKKGDIAVLKKPEPPKPAEAEQGKDDGGKRKRRFTF